MGHCIHAFLFRGPIDRAAPAALGLDGVVWCDLPEGVVALPLPLALCDALEEAGAAGARLPDPGGAPWVRPAGMLHLDEAPWRLARAIARGTRFAYVETDYFGGVGEQHAASWDGDGALLGPDPTGQTPRRINEALADLGVEAAPGVDTDGQPLDAFDTIGLTVMRDDDDFADGYAARVFGIYGRRLIGRYAAPGAAPEWPEWIDVRAEPPVLGRWDGAALRAWRPLPGGRFAEDAPDGGPPRVYEPAYERDGTPVLVRSPDGARWAYNDGPNLVERWPQVAWPPLGTYRDDAGATLVLREVRRHLYVDDVRVVASGARGGALATLTGEPIARDADAIVWRGRRWYRAP